MQLFGIDLILLLSFCSICETNFFVELLKLFKQYCWNNFLHNYVKKCLVYGIQAFDTIPNSTQLVISALQKHVSINYVEDYINANLLTFSLLDYC